MLPNYNVSTNKTFVHEFVNNFALAREQMSAETDLKIFDESPIIIKNEWLGRI